MYKRQEYNRFTKRDILDAMQFYQENYVTYSRREAERVSAISMPANKRNGLKQKQHLYLARRRKEDMKAIDLPMKSPEGRPKGSGEKSKIVEAVSYTHLDVYKRQLSKNGSISTQTEIRLSVSGKLGLVGTPY